MRRARTDRDRRADDIQEVQLDRDHMHVGRPSAKTRERAEIKKTRRSGFGFEWLLG